MRECWDSDAKKYLKIFTLNKRTKTMPNHNKYENRARSNDMQKLTDFRPHTRLEIRSDLNNRPLARHTAQQRNNNYFSSHKQWKHTCLVFIRDFPLHLLFCAARVAVAFAKYDLCTGSENFWNTQIEIHVLSFGTIPFAGSDCRRCSLYLFRSHLLSLNL